MKPIKNAKSINSYFNVGKNPKMHLYMPIKFDSEYDI